MPVQLRSPKATRAVSVPNPVNISRSPRLVISSALTVAEPPANTALRASAASCAKLMPSRLLDVVYPAGTYDGWLAGSHASSPSSGSRISACRVSHPFMPVRMIEVL